MSVTAHDSLIMAYSPNHPKFVGASSRTSQYLPVKIIEGSSNSSGINPFPRAARPGTFGYLGLLDPRAHQYTFLLLNSL